MLYFPYIILVKYMEKEKIILSIILQTYNHEKYIAQTLESILMQRVDFGYELIICEDCSTDKTREIILQYVDKFENIKLLFNKKNYGVLFTFFTSKYNCSNTKYISILEGDDYWTDPNKLQQQVDFLEKNQDFIGCSHNTELFYEKEHKRENMLKSGDIKSVNDIIGLINGTFYAHTSSYVWKNVFKNSYPKEMCYNKTLMGDYFLSMLYARNGKIKYLDKVMSCYRITDSGIWTKLSEHQKLFNNARALYIYNKLLNYEYDKEFVIRIWHSCNGLQAKQKKERASRVLRLKTWLLKWSSDIFNHLKTDGIVSHKHFRSIIKLFITKLIKISKVSWFTSRLCEFLFNCFFLFDINRYYIYYKVKIYKFLKIKFYKDLEN